MLSTTVKKMTRWIGSTLSHLPLQKVMWGVGDMIKRLSINGLSSFFMCEVRDERKQGRTLPRGEPARYMDCIHVISKACVRTFGGYSSRWGEPCIPRVCVTVLHHSYSHHQSPMWLTYPLPSYTWVGEGRGKRICYVPFQPSFPFFNFK